MPQGSILGPLLFNLYINDLINITLTGDIVLYADDTNIFFSGGNLQQLEIISNNYLHELSKWLHINRLALNTSKTKFMLFYPKNKMVSYEIRLQYCGTALQHVSSHSFLGVTFNKHLSWTNHTNNIRVKVARSVDMLRRLYSFLPGWFRVQLYYSIIHSHFTYCVLLWGIGNKCDIDNLSVLQRRAIRLLNQSNKYITSGNLMMQYNIPDIKETFLLKLAVFVYKQVSLNYDVFFNKFLNRTTGYSLRHTYVVDRVCTSYGMQMMDYLIMKLCNDYPDVISIAKGCRNVRKFKSTARILFLSANELSLQRCKFVC